MITSLATTRLCLLPAAKEAFQHSSGVVAASKKIPKQIVVNVSLLYNGPVRQCAL